MRRGAPGGCTSAEGAVQHPDSNSVATRGSRDVVTRFTIMHLVVRRPCVAVSVQGLTRESLVLPSGADWNGRNVQDPCTGQRTVWYTDDNFSIEMERSRCFRSTSSFESAVLAAANLGDDADTTAAIVGQVAGAFYGLKGIPKYWLRRLHRGDEILSTAEALYAAAVAR